MADHGPGDANGRQPVAAPGPEPRSLARIRLWLLGLALAQRVAYRFESTALPFAEAPLYDSAVYLRQADAIRAGEFGDAALLAFSPLYGWFLALTGERWLEAQLALGLATAFLVERIGARHSQAAGVAALALWIGYPLPLFYETKIMSETLGLFLLVASVALFLARDRRPRAMAASGVVLALAILARASLLFAAPFAVLAALAPAIDRAGGSSASDPPRSAEPRRAAAQRALAFAAGLALVLGANGAWNLAHVGRFVPVIMVSRTASVASSHGAWTGSLAVFGTDGAPPSAWDVVEQAEVELGRRPAPEGAGRPASGIAVGGWLVSAPAKLARTLSDVETTFDYAFYGERTESRSLAWQPISIGTLLVLGLLGAILLARARGLAALVPHLPPLACVIVVTTLFHPSSRYRLPMIVTLAVLGAIGLVELARLDRRDVRRGLAAAVALVCVVLAMRHLTHPLAEPGLWEVRVAEGEALRGDVGAARARLERAYALSEEGDATRARIDLLRRHRALPQPPP